MKISLDCYPCFLRQAVIAARLGTDDPALHEKVIRSVLPDIERADPDKSPAHATTFIHRKIREVLGKDPFKDNKSHYNQVALSSYAGLKEKVWASSDPLLTAARLAIAGNIIDFGIFTSIDIDATVEKALSGPIHSDDYALFETAVRETKRILYLADNAGEIVFDRILIEVLASMGKEVTLVVKGKPVLNDVTIEDARQAGIDGTCRIIDNGSDCIGTILEMTSEDFNRHWAEAGLVISKGQGNFETLMHEKGKSIFYLFQSKCEVVCRELDVPLKAMMLKRN
ncbi:MAG: ARMT1-like domain-containing protein [Nitrospiraceae bacterium]|nr:ARMT1-like domain-containing protein [Nitrospiraceae bacterium]